MPVGVAVNPASVVDWALIFSGFWSAFWLFFGIVVGALIQYGLGRAAARDARRLALQVLKVEIQMNLLEAERFRERILYLRERISADQIETEDIFVTTSGFDYSALPPLVNSGFFHSSLGADSVRRYLEFQRFFNNGYATTINSVLRTEHERGKSLDYLDWLETRASYLKAEMAAIVP